MAAGYEFMNPFSKNPAGFDISYQSTAAPTTDDKEKYSHPVIHDDKRLGVQLYSKKEDSSMGMCFLLDLSSDTVEAIAWGYEMLHLSMVGILSVSTQQSVL